jgi:hypothetical protein
MVWYRERGVILSRRVIGVFVVGPMTIGILQGVGGC